MGKTTGHAVVSLQGFPFSRLKATFLSVSFMPSKMIGEGPSCELLPFPYPLSLLWKRDGKFMTARKGRKKMYSFSERKGRRRRRREGKEGGRQPLLSSSSFFLPCCSLVLGGLSFCPPSLLTPQSSLLCLGLMPHGLAGRCDELNPNAFLLLYDGDYCF